MGTEKEDIKNIKDEIINLKRFVLNLQHRLHSHLKKIPGVSIIEDLENETLKNKFKEDIKE